MADFISRFEDDKRAATVCYLMPLILLPILLPIGLNLLPAGLVCLVLLLAIAILAPKASRLRFHAFQAMLMSMVSLAGIGILYLSIIYGVGINPEGGLVGGLIYLGIWMLLVAGILLTFLIFTGILVFKTWRGKTAQLPLLGEWAAAISEGDYTVLKWVAVLPGIVGIAKVSTYYEADLFCMGILMFLIGGIVLAFLFFTGSSAFTIWQGKDVYVPFIGEWARKFSEVHHVALKWTIVILWIAGAVLLSNHYQNEIEPKQLPQNILQEFDIYLHAFPMGASKEEVYNHAREIDGKSELKHSQHWETDNKEITFSGYPAYLQFMFRDYWGKSSLYSMSIRISSDKAPIGQIEQIYWQLHKELTERYGQSLETGYPPWRSPGSKAWRPGEGALWEITPAGCKAFILMISLQTEELPGDGRGEFRIECKKMENQQ